MSKCENCGNELITGDFHWELGLCNRCYNVIYYKDPMYNTACDERQIQIRENYIENLKHQIEEKDKEITKLKNELLQPQSEIINSKEDVIDVIKSLNLLQNKKAIEELEKTLEYCKNKFNWFENSKHKDGYDNTDISNAYYDIQCVIEDRIKQLKG